MTSARIVAHAAWVAAVVGLAPFAWIWMDPPLPHPGNIAVVVFVYGWGIVWGLVSVGAAVLAVVLREP